MNAIDPTRRETVCRRWILKALAAAPLAGAAILGSGCASQPPAPPFDPVRGPGTPLEDRLSSYPNITLQDGLENVLVMDRPTVIPPDGSRPLTVRVPLRSIADEPLVVQYCFLFFGDDKEVLTPEPVWHPATVAPRMRQVFQSNAQHVRAVDWELQVRGWRR